MMHIFWSVSADVRHARRVVPGTYLATTSNQAHLPLVEVHTSYPRANGCSSSAAPRRTARQYPVLALERRFSSGELSGACDRFARRTAMYMRAEIAGTMPAHQPAPMPAAGPALPPRYV